MKAPGHFCALAAPSFSSNASRMARVPRREGRSDALRWPPIVPGALLAGVLGLAACDDTNGAADADGGAGHGSGAGAGSSAGGADAGTQPRAFHTPVMMRDGIRLDTRVVLPSEGSGPWPALLLRSPYLLDGSDAVVSVFRGFTDDGYALVVQACRGTADSEGTLDPLAQEFPDGHDTVAWLTAQPWSNGRVGTFGASYEGFTAGAAAISSPAVAAVVMDGAITRAFEGWPGQRGIGVDYGMLMWWTWVEGLPDAGADPAYLSLIANARPVRDHDLSYFGEEVAVWRALLPHLDRSSAFWDERSLVGRMNRLCIPVLHLQASQEWADDPLAAFLDAQGTECSAAERATQRFVLGSHTHGGALYDPFGSTPSSTLVRQYFARYLKDEPVPLETAPRVQYHLAGADTWGASATWPPSGASSALYLDASGALSAAEAPEGSRALSLDPATDDPCDASYDKYVSFVSAPLARGLDLVGRAAVRLRVEIDAPDADLYASLYTLSPANAYVRVHATRMRLRFRDSYAAPAPMTPGVAAEVRIELPAVAMRLPAGHRLALFVSGAECGTPENPHTGGPTADETETLPTTIRVHTGGAAPSRLELPVLEAH
jgi:uncharacterized protein